MIFGWSACRVSLVQYALICGTTIGTVCLSRDLEPIYAVWRRKSCSQWMVYALKCKGSVNGRSESKKSIRPFQHFKKKLRNILGICGSCTCTVRVIIIETLSVGAYQAWRQNIYQLAPNLPMLSDKSRPLYVVVCCSGQLHMNCARIRSGR